LVLSRVRLIRVRLVLVNLNPIKDTYIQRACVQDSGKMSVVLVVCELKDTLWQVQAGKDAQNASSCTSFFAREPRTIWLFCGQIKASYACSLPCIVWIPQFLDLFRKRFPNLGKLLSIFFEFWQSSLAKSDLIISGSYTNHCYYILQFTATWPVMVGELQEGGGSAFIQFKIHTATHCNTLVNLSGWWSCSHEIQETYQQTATHCNKL